jgi:NADH-quinone oxidoreductase subunit M
MSQLPLLSLLTFLPLGGAILVLLIQGTPEIVARNARQAALWISVVTFLLALTLWGLFNPLDPHFQFVENHPWIPSQNIHYHMGVDGISLLLVVLTAFLVPLCILVTWETVQTRVRECMAAFLILEASTLGTFCALDFLLFYVFFEALLIPMFFIIGIWGGERRIYASFKFFLYTFLGSILMLLGILTIFFEIGTTDIPMVMAYHFDVDKQWWLWLAFFSAFAVKIPMWPFHTWLPDAHVEAPTAGSLILAGILLKMGGYGFIRICIPIFPEACVIFQPLIFTLSIIGIIYASLVAWVQDDMKKLVAYSSIAHMGFVTLGIFSLTPEGVAGAVVQMISHGVISAGLFFCVGVVYDRKHTRQMAMYGGVVQRMPLYGIGFLILTMASIGLPGTSGFVGEFLVLMGVYGVSPSLALGAATAMVLGAIYALTMYGRVMLGTLPATLKSLQDLTYRELLIIIPLVIATLFFGIYPRPLLHTTETTIRTLLAHVDGGRLPQDNEKEETHGSGGSGSYSDVDSMEDEAGGDGGDEEAGSLTEENS